MNQILYHDFFHIGKFPLYLKITTLRKPPDFKEIKKFIPKADENGLVNQKVKYKELYKLIVNEIPEVKYNDIDKYTKKMNLKLMKLIIG